MFLETEKNMRTSIYERKEAAVDYSYHILFLQHVSYQIRSKIIIHHFIFILFFNADKLCIYNMKHKIYMRSYSYLYRKAKELKR